MATTTGYSGTPLAKKLGLKERMAMRIVNQPANYRSFFTDWPAGLSPNSDNATKKDLIHFFTDNAQELFRLLPLLRTEITENGMIWVSWQKKASGVATDVTEDLIREFAIRNDLVDVKVCAVSEVWSGLKLVIPVAKRKKN